MSKDIASFQDVQNLTEFFSRGAIGTRSDTGEKAAYLAGERRCKDVCVFLNVLLDNSSSMKESCGGGKSRLQVALDCLNTIVKDKTLQLRHPDSLVVHTFNNDVIIRLCNHPDKYDHGKLIDSINTDYGNGSYTRMRDAIDEGLKNMEKHAGEKTRRGLRVVRYLLVLTDGADNRSSMSLDGLRERITAAGRRLENLHLVIIAAGMEKAAVADLERLCNGPVPVQVLTVTKADDVSIRDAFARAMEYLRALLYRDPSGKLVVTQYVGTDTERVRRMDEQAAVMMGQRFPNARMVGGRDEIGKLMLLMGSR